MLIDERMTILGSYNMDMRSTYQDTELMLAVDSMELNAKIAKETENDKTYSRIMGEDGTYIYGEYYKEKEMSLGKKAFYGLLRILTIPIRRFLQFPSDASCKNRSIVPANSLNEQQTYFSIIFKQKISLLSLNVPETEDKNPDCNHKE